MNAFVVLLLCGVVGSVLAEYPQRQLPYHVGPNDHYSVEVSPSISQEQSARLFWPNQGSNQVGGSGLWATLTNKFPILNNMFGRMELANDYNLPHAPYHQYFQTYQQPQPQLYQQPQSYYQQPQTYYQQPQNNYQQPQYQYQRPQFYQQQIAPFRQRLTPFGRDVGFTDDAVIVTPPQVPIVPQPAPQPLPAPAPGGGYSYSKPQYRLDLPHK